MKKFCFNPALILAIIVFLAGILNIYSAFFLHSSRWMSFVEETFPLELRRASRTLALISGVSLMFLARGLSKKKYRAWLISVLLLSLSLIFHLIKGLDIDVIFALLLPLVLLFIFRLEFTVQSATKTLYKRAQIAAVVFVTLFLYSTAGFFLLQGQFTKKITLTNIYKDYEYTITGVGKDTLVPTTRRAVWFEDSIATVGWLTMLSILLILFGPRFFPYETNEEDIKKAKQAVLNNGYFPISFFCLMPDKKYFFTSGLEGFVAYKIKANTALALGSPVAPKENIKPLAKNFYQAMLRQGLSCAFYQITEEDKSIFEFLGLKFLEIGNDAIINTLNFDLSLPAYKNIRNSCSYIKRQNVSFVWFQMDELPWRAMSQINFLHQEWLKDKKSQGMAFSMEFFPFPPDKEGEVLLAYDIKGSLLGFFSFFPFASGKGRNLDLMHKAKSAPNGLVEAALAEVIDKFKNNGVEQVSLGLATKVEKKQEDPTPLAQRGLDLFYKFGDLFYKNYKTLTFFKEKFHPSWQPRFLAYSSDAELPKIALAVTQAHLK